MKYSFYLALLVLFFACAEENGDSMDHDSVSVSEQQLDSLCPDAPMNVAIVVTDGVYNTELTAPMDIFEHTKYRCIHAMHVFTVSETGFVVKTAEGLKIIPDLHFYEDSLPNHCCPGKV